MEKISNQALNRLDEQGFKEAPKFPLVFVLENVRSALNVGSVFRTADGFRCEAVFLVGYTATPANREMYKTALGATDTVRWEHFERSDQALIRLREMGYRIFAAEQVKEPIYLNDFTVQPDDKIAVVFGNEISGVDQLTIQQCDGVIEIPQFGTKHSFNVAVSAGMMGWHIMNQFLKR
ncbi:MAG TPA: RNA methyltransferase [Luteibaculaceae bacterium]|nr:RNA methyltransferase [Luteibaculaceae bacterium]